MCMIEFMCQRNVSAHTRGLYNARHIALLGCAALVMFIAWGGLFVARVHAQTPPEKIQGQVVNGTHDAPPNSVANLPVTLFQVGPKGPVEKTVNTDAQGNFIVTEVVTDANAYFARVEYQDIKYYSEIVPAPMIASTPLTVTIYETQTVPANFVIDRLHLILEVQPKVLQGMEFLQVSNPTDRVFMISLPLPQKYGTVQFQDTRDQGRADRLADGTILYPIMPTTTEVLYNLDVPYDATNLTLSEPISHNVGGVNLLLGKTGDVSASGKNLTPSNPFKSQNGQEYVVYAAPPQTAGSVFTATISNLPGPDSTQNVQSLILVAGGLGGLALLAYPVYRRRAAKNKMQSANRHATIVQTIARLDDAYARDEIDENDYQAQRAALKAELLNETVSSKQ